MSANESAFRLSAPLRQLASSQKRIERKRGTRLIAPSHITFPAMRQPRAAIVFEIDRLSDFACIGRRLCVTGRAEGATKPAQQDRTDDELQ